MATSLSSEVAYVHPLLRGWLAGMGHDAYAATDVDSPGLSTRTSASGATAAT